MSMVPCTSGRGHKSTGSLGGSWAPTPFVALLEAMRVIYLSTPPRHRSPSPGSWSMSCVTTRCTTTLSYTPLSIELGLNWIRRQTVSMRSIPTNCTATGSRATCWGSGWTGPGGGRGHLARKTKGLSPRCSPIGMAGSKSWERQRSRSYLICQPTKARP